jgi:RNA polymerase sigma factor (sigma-70 family)
MVQDEFATAPAWDEDWVGRLKRLETRAWDDLVRCYGDELRSDIQLSLRKRGLPQDWMSDIEQDTWTTAIRKIAEFDWQSIDKFYHWLRVIALNRVRMLKRKQYDELFSMDAIEDNESVGGISLDNFLYTNGISENSPEQKLLYRERMALLEGALRELKPRDREILLRRMIQGETPRELAVVYGLEARSISMILLRAKQTLERHLAASEFFKKERDKHG